jgi:uncharacterized protein (TIGR00661 family)
MVQTGIKRKRILVAPLDWGLGHASRCIPIIRALSGAGHNVIIGADGNPARMLSEEFPLLPLVKISNYAMRYSRIPLLLAIKFPLLVAKVYRKAAQEHSETRKIVDKEHIDAIISDQRFGCHSKKIKSIYISHQLCVKMPQGFSWLEKIIANRLKKTAEIFNELWIPDFPGDDNLTGDLTRKYSLPPHHRFIGPLSRFEGLPGNTPDSSEPDVLVILSGPEPQRTVLENILRKELLSLNRKSTMLLGRPDRTTSQNISSNLTIFSHVSSATAASLIKNAKIIVSRGGYTTIMELVLARKHAILIPTPGQTEQEYLCQRLAKKGLFITNTQKALCLEKAIAEADKLTPINIMAKPELLKKAVERLFYE